MKKLLLIDGNNILHRAYHGLPLLKTSDGRYTNAVFGFLKMLHKILEQEQPTHIAICFDKGKNTFRHQMYPEYKAQRKPTDPELVEQFPLIREVLTLNGYLCLESDEYEADDLMGTLAKRAASEGHSAVIFSGDKDLLQVLDDRITVVSGKKQLTDLVSISTADFMEKYGIEPCRLIDLKGLMGDASDNIPGVKGVGEKTALKFLTAYETLENLYDHIDDLPKNKMREKLENDRDNAFLSKKLATICTEAPIGVSWDDMIPSEKDYDKLIVLYRDLEFRNLLKELESEKPADLFSDNLFDMSAKDRPFEIFIENDYGFLDMNEISVLLNEDTLYIADPAKRCVALSLKKDLDVIRDIFLDSSVKKHIADYKSICHLCLDQDIKCRGVVDAIEILAYIDDSDLTSYQVSNLSFRYLKTDTFLFEDDRFYAEAAIIFDLCSILRDHLEESNGMSLYLDVELPLVSVLADMEYAGIRVDRNTLQSMSKDLGKEIGNIASEIFELAGEEFNLNSPMQMQTILFDKLDLPKGKKTKSGGYSTNNEVLEGLKEFHPIIEKILKYRMLSKLKSTYTDAIGKLISAETGHVHTKFLQTVTTTGRLSSADPNLQNIPVRVEEGRKIRQAFCSSDDDHVLLAADYSQIELRMLAHFSEDPVLIDSFVKEEDIHRRTAGEIFGVSVNDVTSDMRRAAKTVNFGIIYGMSSYSLGNDLGVTRKVAQDYIDHYFARYPNVKNYLDKTISDARNSGYSVTMMGRRRLLADINSKNFNLRSFAERTAMNTPLQGSAADIIKLAMVKLHRAFEAKGLKSKLILQVHDELIVDCLISELDEIKILLKDTMENCVNLRVPLTVDMKQGKDWYHMEKI